MNYHLICVHPHAKYKKGQVVTDPAEVAALLLKNKHRFVKIVAPPATQAE